MRSRARAGRVTAEQGRGDVGFLPAHLILGGTAVCRAVAPTICSAQHDPSSGFYARWSHRQLDDLRWWTSHGEPRPAPRPVSPPAWRVTQGTVLEALRDVESTLTSYSHDQARRQTG